MHSSSMVFQPPRTLVHLALGLSYSLFGLGAIVGTVGLSGMNPLQFSFVRVLIAGILLLLVTLLVKFSTTSHPPEIPETESLLMATTIEEFNYNRILKSGRGYYKEEYQQNYYQWMPQANDWRSFLVLGFLVSMGLGNYLCGLQLAGPIAGSIWQPSMPIWTVAISMIVWKLEKFQVWRVVGVFVAFGGYAGMVLMNDSKQQPEEEEVHPLQVHQHSSAMFLLGNCLFFLASLCGSFFVLLSKELLKVYSPLTVTAWSYLLSSPFLLIATIGSSLVPSWQAIVCPDCEAWDGSVVPLLFFIPRDALPALLYYVLALSMGSWGLILWANKYATGTFVVGYSVVQPIASSVFVVLVILLEWVPDCQQDVEDNGRICLDKPGGGALAGIVGILVGLALIIHTEPKRDEPRHPEWEGRKVLSIETSFVETHNAIYGSMASNGTKSLLRP